jgi:cytochrome c5
MTTGLRIFAGVVVLWTAAGAVAQDDAEFAAMPDGPGKDFVYLVCADCHSMTHVLQRGATYTRGEWRASLKRMTDDFGMAELTDDETSEVLDYLAAAANP